VRDELTRRFGDAAAIAYVDTSDPARRDAFVSEIATIAEKGLLYPVTLIGGEPVYDGAVSYPAIVRAVEARLSQEA
jgi:disulfide oxidoreductase YuzD